MDIITSIAQYLFPRYSKYPDVTVTSAGKEVRAEVCDAKNCWESQLFVYEGPDGAARARESAGKLQAVINDRDLFRGAIVTRDENKIIVTDSWLPGWVPYSTTTVIDLSAEPNKEKEHIQNRLVSFYNGLWASGIMPSANDVARFAVKTLKSHFESGWRFRDPKRSGKLDIAALYMQLEEHDKALALNRQLIDPAKRLAVTQSRDLLVDEAVFQQTDLYRLLGMKNWSGTNFTMAVQLLEDNLLRLESAEKGYMARYNYELLKTCAVARQFFWSGDWPGSEACSPAKTAAYAENATFGHNRYTPTFEDNFLAVRTYLQSGMLSFAGRDLPAAEAAYNKALALVALIEDSGNVFSHVPDRNWELYSPYLTDLDRAISKHFGKPAGLAAFAAGCDLWKTLLGNKLFTKQFDPRYFKVFKAQAHQGLAAIETKQGNMADALAHLETAFTLVRELQRYDLNLFFTSMFEERQTYYEVLVDYGNALLNIYSLDANKDRGKLRLPRELAAEVVRMRSSDPLDIIYLRARFLQGEIAQADSDRAGALKIYGQIAAEIDKKEKQLPAGEAIPQHFRTLRETARLKIAALKEHI